MSNTKHLFDEKSLLSTPRPISSSSIHSDLDTFPERLFSDNESLGILSIGELSIDSNASRQLEKERARATSSLNRLSSVNNLTSLPSRFLRPSDYTNSTSNLQLGNRDDSTISESDLLPDDSSTPRGSSVYDVNMRHSVGYSMSRLSQQLKQTGDVNQLMKQFTQMCSSSATTTSEISDLFHSSKTTEEKLRADEESWNCKNYLTAEIKEFTMNEASKMSMGAFFKGRSDDLPELLAKSPEKNSNPVPLIDTTSAAEQKRQAEENKSLSISTIAKILSDTKQTPNRAVDYFLKAKKSTGNVSAIRIAPNFSDSKEASSKHFSLDSLDESKENVNSNFQETPHNSDKSSLRCASALSSLPNGKLPVATTKSELIWGCIKPGKQISQFFFIRNKSQGRLRLKCTISNLNFKFEQDRSDAAFTNELRITLHPEESKKITVIFAPTVLGACVDNIYFTSLDTHHQHATKQFVKLFAYGGYGSVALDKITKDTSGKFLLSLGSLNNGGMKKSFVIRNTGSLPTFVYLDFASQNLYSSRSVSMCPISAVLQPNEETEVFISYLPEKEEFLYIQNKVNSYVVDIGKISLIYGTDVDRFRLRKIVQRMEEKGMEIHEMSQKLIQQFPNEKCSPDLKLMKESTASLKQIVSLIDSKDIVLTIEKDFDVTHGQYGSDTTMFQSLCSQTADFNDTVAKACTVEPAIIILNPPYKKDDMIYLQNAGPSPIYFLVDSVPAAGLVLEPIEGMANPSEAVVIKVKFEGDRERPAQNVYKVRIFIETDVYEIDVKVMQRN